MQARRTHSGAGRGPHSKCDEHLRHLVASLRAALSHAEAAAAAEAGASIVAVAFRQSRSTAWRNTQTPWSSFTLSKKGDVVMFIACAKARSPDALKDTGAIAA